MDARAAQGNVAHERRRGGRTACPVLVARLTEIRLGAISVRAISDIIAGYANEWVRHTQAPLALRCRWCDEPVGTPLQLYRTWECPHVSPSRDADGCCLRCGVCMAGATCPWCGSSVHLRVDCPKYRRFAVRLNRRDPRVYAMINDLYAMLPNEARRVPL